MTPGERVVAAVRAGYGAALLCLPGAAIRLCTGRTPSVVSTRVARILGARHLTQALLSVLPVAEGRSRLLGPAVDELHAGSMLALAIGGRGPRRAELADAAVALTLAAAGRAAAPPDSNEPW
jgi:hypothetical protein